jgi:hypothetical protein
MRKYCDLEKNDLDILTDSAVLNMEKWFLEQSICICTYVMMCASLAPEQLMLVI